MTLSGRIVLKVALMAVMAMPLMGNKGCDVAERKLKRSAVLGRIASRKFTLPSGKEFDFETVLNQQFEDVVLDHPDFVTINKVTSASMGPDADLLAEWTQSDAMPWGVMAEVPECVIDIPQYYFEGAAPNFEFTSGGGLTFGYDLGGDLNGGYIEGSVHVEIAQLHVNMNGYDYISGTMIGGGEATGKHTKTKIGAAFYMDQWVIAPELYFESSLGKVSRKGLNKALDDLSKELKERDPWQARVYDVAFRNGYMYIIINAGNRAGVQPGDKFEIYNLEHLWEDANEPCESRYLGNYKHPKYSVATIEIMGVGYDYAEGMVVEGTDYMPQKGAMVVVKSLKQPEPKKK